MSRQPDHEPRCEQPDTPTLELVVVARSRAVGGLAVRRSLPTSQRRHVGPFVFLDHFGPLGFEPGRGLVPPHPHIGLATVTYLLEGELLHRDSLGTAQAIRPGDVNWMTAGRGIAHSERTPSAQRPAGPRLHLVQAWVALPAEHEEDAPSFQHHGADALPRVDLDGAQVRLIVGSAYGGTSPVAVRSPMVYADVRLEPRAELPLPDEHAERAVYVVEGALQVDGRRFDAGTLLVVRAGAGARVCADGAARVMLLGGAPLGERHMWWNFVSSSKERIALAKRDWKEDRFPRVPGDEGERVPAPDL